MTPTGAAIGTVPTDPTGTTLISNPACPLPGQGRADRALGHSRIADTLEQVHIRVQGDASVAAVRARDNP